MIRNILNHIKYWGEIYIAFPLAILFTYITIVIIQFVNGRPIVGDSPDVILGWLYNLIGVVITMIATGLCQNSLFGYRSNRPDSKLSDDVFDAFITLSLLIYFGYFIWK